MFAVSAADPVFESVGKVKQSNKILVLLLCLLNMITISIYKVEHTVCVW